GADLATKIANQAGADDGAIRLVHELTQFANVDVLAVALRDKFGAAVRSNHRGGASNARTRERAEPQCHFNDVAVDRYPLCFRVCWNKVTINSRAQFDTRRYVFREREGDIE